MVQAQCEAVWMVMLLLVWYVYSSPVCVTATRPLLRLEPFPAICPA